MYFSPFSTHPQSPIVLSHTKWSLIHTHLSLTFFFFSLFFFIFVPHDFSSANFANAVVAVVKSICEHYHVRLLFTPKLTNSTKQRKISWHLLSLKTSNQVMLQTATIIKKEKRVNAIERVEVGKSGSISRFHVFIFISHWLNNRDRSHTTENKNMGMVLRESDKFSACAVYAILCVRCACRFSPSVFFHTLILSLTSICLYSLRYHL